MIGGCSSQCCVVYHVMEKESVPYRKIYEHRCSVHAQAAAAAAAPPAAACSLSNTKRRPREGLLFSAASLCGGRASAPLELSLQRDVWSSPLTHLAQQRHPAGDNNSVPHLKIRRQVIIHGWPRPPIGVFSYFPRTFGNISSLNYVANARRRNVRFAQTTNRQFPKSAKTVQH